MFNTIEAVSQIETDTGIVKDVKFYSTFCGNNISKIAFSRLVDQLMFEKNNNRN